MGFVPPLNLGGFQPSPATLAQWVYQIWQYLQENPIATKEQLQEYIGTFITTSPETQAMIGAGVEEYLTENPPTAPVQSVQGKTGAVVLAYKDIVAAGNSVPVYRYVGSAESMPTTATLQGQYSIGYRLWVHAANRELYTLKADGTYELIGRGKFDGTTIDVNTTVGETTIAEALQALDEWKNNTVNQAITDMKYHAGDSVSDNTVKLGYGQTNNTDTTKSQIVVNIYLPKPIDDKVTKISFTSGSSVVVRGGGSRLPGNGTATIGTTSNWEYVSSVIYKHLGVVRMTFNVPKASDIEQNAITLAGPIEFSFTDD